MIDVRDVILPGDMKDLMNRGGAKAAASVARL